MNYQHAEAFCLMWYACNECGHRERFWNSRDGVTPFSMLCPSCGLPSLRHVDWKLDERNRYYRPHPGQRLWINLTKEKAESIALRRVAQFDPSAVNNLELIERVASDLFAGGGAPDLAVYGHDFQFTEEKR